LIGLARTVALENARMKITCNCVALGYFDAGMLYQIPEQLREQLRMKIPLERFGRIEELTKTVEYLIATEYITGQVISLNGGMYMG
jgi:3-oxoacyl-[acyl-carrier protein] reductase